MLPWGMGSLPSREKTLSMPEVAASTMQAPLPTQAVPRDFLALALCDFPCGVGAAAVLRMGEQLRVLSEDGEWWHVASEVSGKECHVPSSCVAKVRHRWLYEGISRQKAEELLLRPGNRSGAFLIRESQSRQGCYSLSVRHGGGAGWDSVTHYRIQRLDNGWVYIAPRLTFPSLQRLVQHYAELGEGLCCSLGEPCAMDGPRLAPLPARPAVVKKPSLKWDQIDSSLLLSAPTAPLDEDSPISPGLRESISSYLLLAETDGGEQDPAGKGAKKS
ncbi:src-like-adapter 2 [Melanerpes formicivorus]|uniref:src-like-adapter 2 n=1 Tax=Melanerpes formicivorus TaxID=211600 RepID=UPI00358F53CE